jgi:LmbE family N-acetylglucosaminyl deacetylase
MKNYFQRILVLSPHTDDGELGCGGSISLFTARGSRVYWVVFSSFNPDVRPSDKLIREYLLSRKVMGISEWTDLNMQMRMLHENRQAILDRLFEIKRDFDPDLVFCPSPNDIHRDHKTIANEAMRAFKNVTTLAYECPWNNPVFNNQAFVKLDASHISLKLDALSCYESMKDKPYFNRNYTIGLAVTRGVQAGSDYAEAFEVLRYVIQ